MRHAKGQWHDKSNGLGIYRLIGIMKSLRNLVIDDDMESVEKTLYEGDFFGGKWELVCFGDPQLSVCECLREVIEGRGEICRGCVDHVQSW